MIASGQYIHYKENKILKAVYISTYLNDFGYGNLVLLTKKPLEIKIVESEDSSSKERINNLKNLVVKKEEKVEVLAQLIIKSNAEKVGEAALTASLASVAIFIRYFVVVDILINLFGKINVEFSPKIKEVITLLKRL